MFFSVILILISAVAGLGQSYSDDGAPQRVVKAIKAGRFIDPVSGTVLENITILVDHDSVKAMGKNVAVPDSAQLIDLSGYTVLPGLIDCHTHLSSAPSGDYYADIDAAVTDAVNKAAAKAGVAADPLTTAAAITACTTSTR